METIAKLIRYLRDPHSKKVKQLKEQYRELDELSNVALEIGDGSAYRSLQSEMRDVFFDYLTAIVVDAIYNIVPHVLILWLLSLKFKIITLPIVNWEMNIFAAYLMAYLGFVLCRRTFNYIKTKLCTKAEVAGFVEAYKIK